ncbi:MAG: MFS transporter [Rhodoblastus sp.]|nr:MFS transporter [Rhodoblastus sp.]
MSEPTQARRVTANRAIVLLAVAAFASAATTRICDGLLPQLASEFRVTPGEAAIVATAYSLTYGLLQPAFGIAGDRYGKYRLILVCCVMSLVTTAACAIAPTLDMLALARLAAGFAAAGIVPLALAWIGDAVPYDVRQTTIARFMMGQISGLIVGQAFGGWFGDLAGWRAAFLVILGLYALATIGLTFELRRNPLANGAPSKAPLSAAIATFVGALRRPSVRALMLAVFLEGFFCFGAVAYITTMLHFRFGLTFGQAGLLLIAFGLGGIAYATLARRIVPRFGEAGVARISGALFCLAFLGLALAPAPLYAAPACLAAGAGYYLLHSVLQVNATQATPEARGAGMSIFATSFFLGQAGGVAAAAPIVDRYGARTVFVIAAVALPALAFWVAQKVATRGERA